MKKIGLLSLALVLALGSLGIGYAAWTDTLTITGTVATGDLDWEFAGAPGQSDAGVDQNVFFTLESWNWVLMDKDVASTSVEFTDNHTLTVTIDNAYPYYANHISFVVHGLGSIPLRIWKVNFLVNDSVVETIYEGDQYIYLDLDGDTFADLEIWWGSYFGLQLHAGDHLDKSFNLLVLQPAPQDAQLTFSIEIVAIQFDQYTPGPIQ